MDFCYPPASNSCCIASNLDSFKLHIRNPWWNRNHCRRFPYCRKNDNELKINWTWKIMENPQIIRSSTRNVPFKQCTYTALGKVSAIFLLKLSPPTIQIITWLTPNVLPAEFPQNHGEIGWVSHVRGFLKSACASWSCWPTFCNLSLITWYQDKINITDTWQI